MTMPGEEIGSASFSNGELDAAHCTSWNFTKEETEVIGEDDVAQTITISYSKELNPLVYQSEVDTDNYYDQFNDAVLSENITETVSGRRGKYPVQDKYHHPGEKSFRSDCHI